MYKLICCNVFQREACACIATSPKTLDVEFTELGEHSRSGRLRELIQARIDAAEASGKNYEAILLLFGLCGNATVGIQARKTQLVMPRAHDCCTILLGSRQRFVEHFGAAPSTPFSSAGYVERGEYFMRVDEANSASPSPGNAYQALVEQYGEEDARFIWEQMHPEHDQNQKAVFIDLPETRHLGYAGEFEKKAAEIGREYVYLEGSSRLIRGLIDGNWPESDYLIVPPGGVIDGVYDHDEVVRLKRS